MKEHYDECSRAAYDEKKRVKKGRGNAGTMGILNHDSCSS